MLGHWEILLLLLVVVLLFGSGRISGVMGDIAKGIKSFKKGMADDETIENKPADGAINNSAGLKSENTTRDDSKS